VLHKYNSLKYRTSKLLGALAVEAPSRFSVPPVRAGSSLRTDQARLSGRVNPRCGCLPEMRVSACLSGLIVRGPLA